MKKAFTLAEVLITLAIIGIVAAVTIPGLIQKYKKTEIETKLKRFYSMANQAIALSEIDNGPKNTWLFENSEHCVQSGTYSEECLTNFWNRYLKKYFKYNKTEFISNTTGTKPAGLHIYLADGSVVCISHAGKDYQYFINAHSLNNPVSGKDAFMFGFYTNSNETEYGHKAYYGKGIEPYVSYYLYDDEGNIVKEATEDDLYELKCYSKIIQLNGWKIPDDYPIKL